MADEISEEALKLCFVAGPIGKRAASFGTWFNIHVFFLIGGWTGGIDRGYSAS